MPTRRLLLYVLAFLLLGAGGFFMAISTNDPSSSPFPSVPAEQMLSQDRTDPASLSLSISDEPVVLEAELNDTELDIYEDDIADLEREINSE